MKTRSEFLPHCLAVLPSLDFFNPGEDPAAGGGTLVGPFDTVDFEMFSPSSTTNYTELHLQSAAEGGTTPISAGADTERTMLIMQLPTIGAPWSMALQLTNGSENDTVQMQSIAGKYSVLRATLVTGSNLRYEQVDEFFTIEASANHFETYLHVNLTDEVVKLSYANMDTFNAFSVSFLTKSNA